MTSSSDLASWPFHTKIIQLRERMCLLPLSHKPPPFYMPPSKSPLSWTTGGCTGGGGSRLGGTVGGGVGTSETSAGGSSAPSLCEVPKY